MLGKRILLIGLIFHKVTTTMQLVVVPYISPGNRVGAAVPSGPAALGKILSHVLAKRILKFKHA
jgi:hypothetical protein